jgi:hypothetical protein
MRRVMTVRLEPGTQQRVYNEAPLPVLEAIIDQHRQYGLVPVDEVVRAKAFVGLCYSFDKPVDLERMTYGVDHNQGVLQERGVEQRQAAAMAVDQALETAERNMQGGQVTNVEVELIEEGDSPTMAAGMQINRDRAPPANGDGRRGRRG